MIMTRITSQEAGVEKPHSHFFDVCLEKVPEKNPDFPVIVS